MSHLLALLRDGEFLTRPRIRLWAAAFVVGFAAAILYMAATAHGLNDYKGRPLGTDFSDVYTAGLMADEGAAAAAYDPARHYAREQAVFGHATPFYGWHYPPFFLAIAAALSQLSYLPALILWQAATLALYLAAVSLLLPRPRDPLWLLLALAFPAVFVNLGHGQNGFLTTALFAGALGLLDRRPVIAGILFGLVAYKPQFGVMIPLVLAVSGRWRCFAAATATVVALGLVATFAFGTGIWTAFLVSTHFSRTVVLEQGGTGFEKIQSAFAAARLLGASIDTAYALQAVLILGVTVGLAVLWRSPANTAYKGAALCLGALLATPYCLDYDMMLLAPAIALLVTDRGPQGFLPYEKTMLAALWFVPIVTRGADGATHVPLGLIVMALSFALVLRRSRATLSAAA